MAMWYLRCILQILIIFHFSYFLSSAQLQDYATAQISTSWMNNYLSVVNFTNPYNNGASGPAGPFMLIILLKMISDQVGFACGFLSEDNDNSFPFAFGIARLSYYDFEGRKFFVTDELVWLANRNKLIHENGTLHLLPDGNLVLRDADGTLVWSTNTPNKSVVGMKMMETGNLVLYDGYNRTVWQSFDHPSDTLLQGQKLMAGQKLVDTVSSTNWAEGPFMRIILLKVISDRVGFACGFLSPGNDTSFSFAIGIVERRETFSQSGEYVWTYLELVWLANRNKLIHENGTLHLLPDGNLVLRDADGTLVWSTNTSNKSVVGMKMMETGNLVLYDDYNRTVWQSFDHPSDTLLQGQKLMAGQNLVAGVSSTNWAEGNYYLTVTSQGLFAFYRSDIQQMYFEFLVRGTRKSIQTSYVKSINGTLVLYISSTEPSEPDAVFSKPSNSSNILYMKLDFDGHFRVYGVGNEPVDLLADFLTECDYPLACGSYGLCSNGDCSCPAGFSNSSDGTGGCSEIAPETCEGPQSQRLLQLTNVYYFNYIDSDAAVLKGTDIESCKQECLKNCSCKAALFRYFHNVSHGNCFLPSPVLSLISDGKSRTPYQSSAFIKISGDSAKSSSSLSVGRVVLIAGSCLGGLVLVGMAIGIFVVFSRKRRTSQEDDDDDFFDQLSGMPLRFTFEELKSATENFHIKLGEGGFGSVFEGSLSNGEKIAVKRLDGLGQGKKEFLAEVKTIGSIHHVNLVRLIGFCAETQHRLLVYGFMCNGSLDRWIFAKHLDQPTFDWQARRNIILDIAKGLAYLHEGCRQMIVHLDIKPQNILLDSNLRAKVSDFGLSKLIDRDQSHTVTTMRGTPGYLAPEWLTSVITEKADVYSFGVVVMEIVTGRKNLDRSQPEERMHLLSLLKEKAEENQLIELVDKNSDDMQLHGNEVVGMMRLAAWCLQQDFTRRPSMSMVVKVVEGSMDIEADLVYTFSNPQNVEALRKDSELRYTATVLPSILSGPR